MQKEEHRQARRLHYGKVERVYLTQIKLSLISWIMPEDALIIVLHPSISEEYGTRDQDSISSVVITVNMYTFALDSAFAEFFPLVKIKYR